VIEHHGGIGTEHWLTLRSGKLLPERFGLQHRETTDVLLGVLAAARGLVDVDRLHAMRHADLIEQRTASG
jgi:hypothetical protein